MSILSVKTTTHKITTRVTTHQRVYDETPEGKPAIVMAENLMKDIQKYSDMDIDELLSRLSEEEMEQLTNMVDPDDSLIPPSERCRTQTKKKPTGPLNRRHLLEFLEKYAKEQEDWPEAKPFQAGQKRGKVFVPRIQPKPAHDDDVEVELDLGDDYKQALNTANESELVDLAAILGLHSMISQDQYHDTLTNKKQKPGSAFESLVKATMPKAIPMEPDNDTNVHETSAKVAQNDPGLKDLNWNNIKNIPRKDFKALFEGLKTNTHLETLSLANTDMTDRIVQPLLEALKHNKTLKSLNIESNYISGPMLKNFVEATLEQQTLEDLRAANQRPVILGNKIEMEIAKLVEKNKNLLRLGISFDVPDARMRVAQHLQNNYDRLRLKRMGVDRA
ncbi:tropomodulin-like isoform X2 [Ornithodoros turicata]|uniref:tropomodulin-like isoform X2 n=1 Tax=Ornithodoros turicata TaxID=34597 RepID=UPI003138E57D